MYCPDYGIPQNRKRLLLLASKLGEISLIKETHSPENYLTVRDAIGDLPKIEAGEISTADQLHRSSKLSPINKKELSSQDLVVLGGIGIQN
ncbi:DNA cytosine methyltransferase [Lysinibacillus parviboronicapiens]|uniref:DNA cytosine methyltransferase n=1 Tax=Lysinibacillus parviboronicapiens TaxID=436516 RepID=UPI002285A855|nr:DNA cytosine methyltransferase [Lysinibacillus parviboronicapiens]